MVQRFFARFVINNCKNIKMQHRILVVEMCNWKTLENAGFYMRVLLYKQIQHVTQTQSLIGWVLFLQREPVMAAARLLRRTRRYLTLACLILSALLGLASFNAYITFSRGSEYLITRSDFVHSLESLWRPLSKATLQRRTGDLRGKKPIVLRFHQ